MKERMRVAFEIAASMLRYLPKEEQREVLERLWLTHCPFPGAKSSYTFITFDPSEDGGVIIEP